MGLKHLKNKTCYELISEEQAWTEINHHKQDIFQWAVDSRGSGGNEIVEYIRASMAEAMKDPFA